MTDTRRELIKKVFVFPLILTWPVLPSFARAGSQDVADDGKPSTDDVVVPLTPTHGETKRRHHQSWWQRIF